MLKLSKAWLEIFSELFVNLSAAWFGVVFVDSQLKSTDGITGIFVLTYKFILGIVSLIIAKRLREEAGR